MDTSKFESITGVVDLPFPEYDAPPAEPFDILQGWLRTAQERQVREPRALALATADSMGKVSSRIVAIAELDARGLVFTTHATSRKARDLTETGWASGVLYWRETAQQIALSGPTVPLSDQEAAVLWFSRPVPMHAMSAASHQSEALRDPSVLRAEAQLLALDGALPRPGRFVGFRLEPQEIEFWCASSDRLHRRLQYRRHADGWSVRRLQP